MKKSILILFSLAVIMMLTVVDAQAEARWKFHFTYGQCPGGKLEVWATRDCHRVQQIFKGYAKECKTYEGVVPGVLPSGIVANDLMFDFYWDYWCNNEDHFKMAIPNHNGTNWELIELPPWIQANIIGELDLPGLGDPTGTIQDVYVVVNLQKYLDNHDPAMIDSFFDVFTELPFTDGENSDLPGYMVSAGPITFNPDASSSGSPFEYGPLGALNGDLVVDGKLNLYNQDETSDPTQLTPVIEELNWQGQIEPSPTSPAWGRVTIPDVTLPRGMYYFQLVLPGGQWPIANMSVESNGQSQTISAKFNLGQPGQQTLDYLYCGVTTEPQQEAPTGQVMTVPVEAVDYQLGLEDDVTVQLIDPNDWIVSLCPVKVSAQLPNLGSVVNQPQPTNYCAAGAISNSLSYLKANGKIPASKDTSLGTVAGVLGTTTTSGTSSSWYQWKQTYSYFTDVVTTRYITAPLTLAKCQDLAKELKDGQDIEMDLVGHVEMLGGIRVKCDGTIELDLFDDNQTDAVSDPMHTSQVTYYGGAQYVDGMELERFVIECPVEKALPFKFIDTLEEWLDAIASGAVRALSEQEGTDYLAQWAQYYDPTGDPYPEDPYVEPNLIVLPAGSQIPLLEGDPLVPEDAGLVMAWDPPENGDSSTGAWALKYDKDPDLSNCIITLAVTAPQFSPGGVNQINNISFGLGSPPMGSGPIRSWQWKCGSAGSGAPIIWGVPTTIKIDTSLTGMGAATPVASGYANNPGFNIQNVTWMVCDENGTWVGPANPAPGPGGFSFMWNYWHWILVSPKTTVDKGIYTKWSQPPVAADPSSDPPLIQGWDEHSNYNMPVVADDWECSDERPVTDIHWWGSFFKIDTATGLTTPWTQPQPPTMPTKFHIGIWTDVPQDANNEYSHPGTLVWENYCDNFVWNFAGYDQDPRNTFLPDAPGSDTQLEACFQFTQLLSQDEWFYQKPMEDGTPRVYWLSIAPIWPQGEAPEWEWGWKSRPHYFNDDAVVIQQATPWSPPMVNSTTWGSGYPVQWPAYPASEGITWDMSFELTTNVPKCPGLTADLSGPAGVPDCVVNLYDFAKMASEWLLTSP